MLIIRKTVCVCVGGGRDQMRTLFYLLNFSVNLHLFYYIANYFFKLNEYIRPLLESLLPVFRRSSSAYSNRIGVYGCANLCQS